MSIVHFKKGERVDLGGGSFSNLLITGSTVAGNKNMMGYSVFRPGINTKQKIHLVAEELAYIVSGSGKITMGRKNIQFKQGDSLYIPAGSPHGVKNDGKEDVVMVFFFSTPSYPRTTDA
jgi:mannose-6-phosphate isomerase-like protein (cupin superfamily)